MGKRIIIPGADFSENAIRQEVDFTLSNGYSTVANSSALYVDDYPPSVAIRVRTNQLYSSYTVKTKQGYIIRSISVYDNSLDITHSGIYDITNGQQISVQDTEYTLTESTRYSIITFSKSDSTQSISPDEDIVEYITHP